MADLFFSTQAEGTASSSWDRHLAKTVQDQMRAMGLRSDEPPPLEEETVYMPLPKPRCSIGSLELTPALLAAAGIGFLLAGGKLIQAALLVGGVYVLCNTNLIKK